MALIDFYSPLYDTGGTDTQWFWDLSGTAVSTSVTLRDGSTGNIYYNSGERTLPSNYTTLIAGQAIKPDGSGGGNLASGLPIHSFKDGTTIQCDCFINSDGSISVRRNGSVVLGTSAVGVVPLNGWTHVEFKLTVNSSTGSYEVRVNGVSVLTGTGKNTQQSANAYVNRYRFDWSWGTQWFSDLYLADTSGSFNNDFLGDIIIKHMVPNAAGNYTQWTPSTGSNYQCVDEAVLSNDDTDYVSSSTVGQKDSYNMADLSNYGIKGIRTAMRARKDDAGTRQIRNFLRTGSSEYTEATKTLGSSYASYFGSMRDTDPNTGSAWTLSGLNAYEIGIEVIA